MRAILAVLTALALCISARAAEPTPPANIPAGYGKLPLSFEANQGQSAPEVRFLSRGSGYSLFLTGQSAVLSLSRRNPTRGNAKVFGPDLDFRKLQPDPSNNAKPAESKTSIVQMRLIGANPGAAVEGEDQLPGVASYFIGNDPAKWSSNISTYARVRYANIYNGIDLVYYGNQRQL